MDFLTKGWDFLNQQSRRFIVARIDGEFVAGCIYYQAEMTFGYVAVPTLCTFNLFPEDEIYELKTFIKGYKALALKHYPTAVYWLAGVNKNDVRYREAYEQASFEKTSVHLPHLNFEQRENNQGFMRLVRKNRNTNIMEVD